MCRSGFGDFNAWTGNENPESSDVTLFLFNRLADENYDPELTSKRTSKDTEVKDFGRYLLNTCDQFGFRILKGTMRGDDCGHFTLYLCIFRWLQCN